MFQTALGKAPKRYAYMLLQLNTIYAEAPLIIG
jgi:hypothetical protein